jgi:DNA-binding beta-propeller fold protein YncE
MPAAIAVTGDSVWIAGSDAGIVRMDRSTSAVTASVEEPPGPVSVAVGAGAVWVGQQRYWGRPPAIWQLSTATATVVRTVPVAWKPVGIAVGNGAVWVAGEDSGVLTEIDPLRGTVIRRLRLGGSLLDVAYAAGAVWATVAGSTA